MKIGSASRSVLTALIILWSGFSTAQSHRLPSPQMTSEDDSGTAPPPPGLVVSIDTDLPGVIVVGLVLGIYFLRKKKISY